MEWAWVVNKLSWSMGSLRKAFLLVGMRWDGIGRDAKNCGIFIILVRQKKQSWYWHDPPARLDLQPTLVSVGESGERVTQGNDLFWVLIHEEKIYFCFMLLFRLILLKTIEMNKHYSDTLDVNPTLPPADLSLKTLFVDLTCQHCPKLWILFAEVKKEEQYNN